MLSTFQGLETARRALNTQQSALYTLGHNVANANTKGYTRQRVNLSQTNAYPVAGMNSPNIPGQIGTGVKANSVERIRDQFIDVQYRGENNKFGYWSSKADSFSMMEGIMNEPTDTGLSKTMDQFWQSLQDLAVNASTSGSRAVVRERGTSLAVTFNYLSNSLTAIKGDMKSEIDVKVKEMNDLIDSIASINDQIASVEPHGYLPNDLYDKRDNLIDRLSSLVNIKVEYKTNGGNSDPQAVGTAVIKLIGDTGELGILVGPYATSKIGVDFNGTDGSVASVTVGTKVLTPEEFNSKGELKAMIQSYGYQKADGSVKGMYPDMLAELDNLAFTFAQEFNRVQAAGISPKEIAAWQEALKTDPTAKIEDFNEAINFFADSGSADETLTKKGYASRMILSEEILSSVDNIATATVENPTLGDASNILALANVIKSKLNYNSQDATEETGFRDYFEKIIGQMAVETQQAYTLAGNSETLLLSAADRRSSVSSVSMDEEMSDMIKFQQAYNASARMITMTDEILDKIINGLGLGGR